MSALGKPPGRPTSRPGGKLVDRPLLASVGFTDHAIARFAQRAGLANPARSSVEPMIRDLLLQEGLLTHRPPSWARSRNAAENYLQLGAWMLFVLRPDPRRPGSHTAVTAVNRSGAADWAAAVSRGYITTPPPPRLEPLPRRFVGLRLSVRDARAERRRPSPRAVLSTYRARRRLRRDERLRVAARNAAARTDYEAARARGRQRWR